MYRNIIYLIGVVGFLWLIGGCGSKEGEYSVDYPVHIQLSKFMETELLISNISSIADSISYIPLETNPDGMIGYAEFHEIPNGFIAWTKNELLFFNREGKYEKSIRLDYVNNMAGVLPDGSCFLGSMMLENPYQMFSSSGNLLAEDTVKLNQGEMRSPSAPDGMYFYRLFLGLPHGSPLSG